MNDPAHTALMNEIVAHPEDDEPRLVYADWLDDAGQADRADFVRVQLERAKLPKWDVRQLPLLIRECELLSQHEVSWRRELPKLKSVNWGRFERGFICQVRFDDFKSLKLHGERCFQLTPLDSVSIEWPGEDAADVDSLPALKELTLGDVSAVWAEDIDRIAHSPILEYVERLFIPEANLTAQAFDTLMMSPLLGNLQVLQVAFNSLGNRGIDAIVTSRYLKSLTEIDLSTRDSYNQYHEDPVIDQQGMESLSEWPGLASVRKLSLSGNDIGSGGLQTLLSSQHALNLKELEVRDAGLARDAARQFLNALDGLKLEVLDIGDNLLLENGFEHLLSSACVDELRWLRVDRCEIPAQCASSLLNASFLPNLCILNASHNYLGVDALESLLDGRATRLHTLQLGDNNLNDDSMQQIAAAEGSSSLQALDLSRNRITDEGVRSLVTSKNLDRLAVLKLNGNAIGTDGTTALLESEVGRQLTWVDSVVESDESIPFT